MKQKTNLSTFIILLFGVMLNTSCKEVDNPDTISDDTQLSSRSAAVNTIWGYPIKPGMEEWNRLRTEPERVAALQVPEHILSRLSAEDAIHLFITFPASGYFASFNTPQNGFYVMLNRFNLFRHLLSRNDIGKGLIAAYKDAGMTGFKTLPYSIEFWMTKLVCFELVLAQKEFLQSLTPEEKLELLSVTREKLSEKIVYKPFATLPGIQSTLRIMANILDMEAYPEFATSSSRQEVTRLMETGMLGEVTLIDEIAIITDHYINAKNKAK